MAQGCNTTHTNTLSCFSISGVQRATATLRTGVAHLSLHFLLNGSGQEDVFSDITHPISELPWSSRSN